MGRFLQLHLLTSYPPANLNRDDLGRPKTAMMGGAMRLRISSQSLKRAWRTSEVFEETLKGHIGVRTKGMGIEIFNMLSNKGVAEKKALDWAKVIADVFGKTKSLTTKEKTKLKEPEISEKDKKALKLKPLEIEQLAHFTPEEEMAINKLIDTIAERGSEPEKDELTLLRKKHSAADVALFGRMLASSPAFNTEAAAQVAHAISVHKITVEDDFFTAIDDLNEDSDDAGAAHMGETEFSAALFYQYICIDRALLQENLGGDTELTNNSIKALIEAAATVSPTGKQNSFASRARASYILCETGKQQPRALSVAFLKPVQGTDMLNTTIKALEDTRNKMDKNYGKCADAEIIMNNLTGEGSLQEIISAAMV